ncbi:MAG: hypothetical protein DWQ31_17310 [Planctomycetota bacterium]|nr:MAG: hypothetical protein DWQ31_17310 [Planctomycetota bacterium]REJ92111.1 MAG: hypothetical protein DWQ35_13260 [Planctomycetota bacterium]REK28647.1 MAG: hypothetical protein DWQ42_04850 [Planctomycetota bacterium]REK39261.1 MAG: hypothetical protein DWQ46_18430 [Planctomycetota bacterium]
MVRSIYRTTRWLVTASLIVSLGLAGLFPQMMVLTERGMRLSVSPSPTKCCCGTEDGRCCGMGCCLARQSPAKEQCPCPNPKNSRDGQNNPLAVALAKALLDEGDEAGRAGTGRPESDLAGSLAPSTLQAKHVRIDA